MNIKFSNRFLFFFGVLFAIMNLISPNVILSFLFGVCFGFIFLNFNSKKLGD